MVKKTEIKKEEKKNVNKIFAAIGRRKSAIAQIKLISGKGEIKINDKKLNEYFPYFELQNIVLAPLKTIGEINKVDILAKITGGGKRGQAEALRLAIARALIKLNQSYRSALKASKFLTRDARIKERKKPGLKRARRAPQWQKR